jgi:hypothetical protein
MTEKLILYFLGAIICSNIIIIWQNTSIPVKIFKMINFISFNILFKNIKNHVITREDWEKYIIVNYGSLGELFTCPLCLATHASWLTYLILFFLSNQIIIFDKSFCLNFFICTFTWPMISNFFLYKLNNLAFKD